MTKFAKSNEEFGFANFNVHSAKRASDTEVSFQMFPMFELNSKRK
jgi:hypothetical protein